MRVEAFFDKTTYTLTYVVFDAKTFDAVIIDPIMDYDPATGTCSLESVENVIKFVQSRKLNVHYIMETHAHADHLSSGQELKKIFSEAKVAIGEDIKKVQETFKKFFNLNDNFKPDGNQFDLLLKDGDKLEAGTLILQVIHTPGHTPSCCSYKIGDAVFTGDTLFMPDFGVARCDFPQGDAGLLFDSVTQKLYSLPDNTRIFVAHDYLPNGRELKYQSTIVESKRSNIHINANTKKEDFVKFRAQRDKTLSAPKLLLPSIQININGGHFPPPENNQISYLKIPLTMDRWKDTPDTPR